MFNEQLKLEQEIISTSIERSEKQFETGYSSAHTVLIRKGIQEIEGDIERLKLKKAGFGLSYMSDILNVLDSDVVAFLSIRQLFISCGRDNSYTQTARAIGQVLYKEYALSVFKKSHPDKYASLTRFMEAEFISSEHNDTSFYIYLKAMRIFDIDFKWDNEKRLTIGIKILRIIENATQFIDVVSFFDNTSKKRKRKILLSAPVLKWSKEFMSDKFLPRRLPMLCKPKSWSATERGGYLNPLLSFDLVKNRKVDDKQSDAVYNAVNAVQSTPFMVNKKVFDVFNELKRRNKGEAGLPIEGEEQLPRCPLCQSKVVSSTKKHSCFKDDKELERSWRSEANAVLKRVASSNGKNIASSKVFSVANYFKDKEAIYFPYHYDFRGRLYPVSYFLSPQGSDLSRGFLKFYKEVEMLTGSEFALGYHGYNVFSSKKLSLHKKTQWVCSNEKNILDTAKDPLRNIWWQQASSPSQFLAFCFEWEAFTKWIATNKTPFYSSLPIAVDGTCNGLQILSLLSKDESTGYLVNLTDTEKPQDIYGFIADKVIEELVRLTEEGVDRYTRPAKTSLNQEEKFMYNERYLAECLLDFGIDRSATKSQVMTLPYSETFYSCCEHTHAWLLERENKHKLFTHNLLYVGYFLGRLIWEAAKEHLSKPMNTMQWVKSVARHKIEQDNAPIKWVMPNGFEILQAYENYDIRRVSSSLYGFFQVTFNKVIEGSVDTRKQKSAIVANLIHSLDAYVLSEVVNRCKEAGIDSMVVIHDSYGVHASYIETLGKIIREVFVDIFSKDMLLYWKQQVFDFDIDEEISYGDIEIENLKRSKYFFS